MSELMPTTAESFFHGDPFHDQVNGTASASPDVRMWQAVVMQAWVDAFTEGEAIRGARPYEWDVVRSEARRWLLLDHGGWKRDRDDVCDNADLDGDAVRRAAIKRMETASIEDTNRRAVALAAIDRAFESLMAREDKMRRADVTRAVRHLAIREANL